MILVSKEDEPLAMKIGEYIREELCNRKPGLLPRFVFGVNGRTFVDWCLECNVDWQKCRHYYGRRSLLERVQKAVGYVLKGDR